MSGPRKRIPGLPAANLLLGLIAMQAVSAAFFLMDVFFDLGENGPTAHVLWELAIVILLLASVIWGTVAIRALRQRSQRAERVADMARSSFAEIVDDEFESWQLTPAEADVALLALKGCSIEDIGRFRRVASGTVRAQLARIYTKAGVANRSELASIFLEELVPGPRSGIDESSSVRPV